MQFLFLCNPQQLGSSRGYTKFRRITQKMLTIDTDHRDSTLAKKIKFEKEIHYFYNISRKSAGKLVYSSYFEPFL